MVSVARVLRLPRLLSWRGALNVVLFLHLRPVVRDVLLMRERGKEDLQQD